ncbi:MAG: hypothetical protein V4581_06410 [Bacteroidota bacterium]
MKIILSVFALLFITGMHAQLNLPKEVTQTKINSDDSEIGEWHIYFNTETQLVYRKNFDFSDQSLKALYKEITSILKMNSLDFKKADATSHFESGENTVDYTNYEAMHAMLATEEDGDLPYYARIDWKKGKHFIVASLWPYEYAIEIYINK